MRHATSQNTQAPVAFLGYACQQQAHGKRCSHKGTYQEKHGQAEVVCLGLLLRHGIAAQQYCPLRKGGQGAGMAVRVRQRWRLGQRTCARARV